MAAGHPIGIVEARGHAVPVLDSDRLAVSLRPGGPGAAARAGRLRDGGGPPAPRSPRRGRGADRTAAGPDAGDRRTVDLRLAADRRVPGVQAIASGLITPRSVTSAVISEAGVTSNAGFRQGASSRVSSARAALRTSSGSR